MPLRQVEKQIGETEYTVGTIGAYEAMDVAVDLVQILAPAFDDPDSASLEKLLNQGADQFIASIAKMALAADKKKVRDITKALAKQTLVKGKDGLPTQLSKVFDTHFSGDFQGLIQWLGFAIGVNFLGFTDGSTSAAKDTLAGWMKEKTAAA